MRSRACWAFFGSHADENGGGQVLDIHDEKTGEVLLIKIGYSGT